VSQKKTYSYGVNNKIQVINHVQRNKCFAWFNIQGLYHIEFCILHTHTHTHTHIYIVHTYIYTQIFIYVHIHVYVSCVCVCVCVCVVALLIAVLRYKPEGGGFEFAVQFILFHLITLKIIYKQYE